MSNHASTHRRSFLKVIASIIGTAIIPEFVAPVLGQEGLAVTAYQDGMLTYYSDFLPLKEGKQVFEFTVAGNFINGPVSCIRLVDVKTEKVKSCDIQPLKIMVGDTLNVTYTIIVGE